MRSRRKMLGVTIATVVTMVAGSGVASASAPTSAQKQVFSALTDKPTAAAPAAVKSVIDGSLGRQFGVDADHVYRVPAPAGGSWSVLPGGNDQVCVVFETHENVSACGPIDQVKTEGLSLSLIDPDPNGGDLSAPANGRTTYLGYAPKALAPSLMRRAGPSTAVKAGFYEVVGKNTQLSSLLSRRAQAFQKHRVSVPAAPKAKKSDFGPYYQCIPSEPRYACQWTWFYGTWGQQQQLDGVMVASLDGNNICGNAALSPGYPWAGAFVCTTSYPVSHPYNGSSRFGWAGPAGLVGGPGYPSASGIGWARAYYH